MMKIDHIALWVTDLEREKEFFLRHFGCSAGAKYCNLTKGFSSYFISFAGGGRIEIMQKKGMAALYDRIEMPGYSHIAINAGTRKDVVRLTEKLEREGVIIDSYPRVTGDGYYESVVLDPENNRIEIVSE